MRRPYEIYKKYRQAQKRYFEQEVKRHLATSYCNCVHNQSCQLGDSSRETSLCNLLGMSGSKIFVCDTDAKASTCPFYEGRFAYRNQVAEHMAAEMKDPEVRRKMFPDIEALRWVMEKDLHAFRQFPPNTTTKIIFRIIVWLEALAKRINAKASVAIDPPTNIPEEVPDEKP